MSKTIRNPKEIIEIDLEPSPPPSRISSPTRTTPRTARDDDELCYVCHTNKSVYAPINCRHLTLCKKCAMKQATGGRCKVCKILFSELKKVLDT